MRKRLALGVSIPAVILFIGLLIALLTPANIFVLTEALDRLGLLGARARLEGLAPPSRRAGQDVPLWIVNGMMWDADEGLRPNPGLAAAGGRILAGADRPPSGTRVIDASGLTILPGLIDMHVHSFGGTFGDEMIIGAGVTSARDLGTHLAGVLGHRADAAAGLRAGPRLFVTGPYLVGGAGTSDQEIGVSGPSEAAGVVERFAQAGVDGIKVLWGIGAETLRAVVEAAHERGLWVAAHLDLVGAAEAARIGVDSIEHGSGIGWDGPEEDSAREAAVRSAIQEMVARGVALTPTLVVAEHAFTIAGLARPENPALRYVPWLARRLWVPSQIANASAARLTPEEIGRRRLQLQRLERFVLRFHRAGGRVLAGSDAPAFLVAPGIDLHRELELLVQAGLTPAEALAAATREAAASLKRERELGGLAAGMRADLLLVRGDPLSAAEGISATRRIVLVVKDGRVMLDRMAD